MALNIPSQREMRKPKGSFKTPTRAILARLAKRNGLLKPGESSSPFPIHELRLRAAG